MIPTLRLTGSFACALAVTLALCLAAPLICRKSDAPRPRPLSPVRIFPIAPPAQKIEEIKIVQKQLLLPPRTREKKQRTKQSLLPEKIRLSPLEPRTAPPLAATLPATVPAALPAAVPSAPKAPAPSPAGGQEIFRLGAVDTPPRLKHYNPPLYPARARGKRVQGKVVVRCVVSPGGKVREARILSAEPQGFFERAALNAVRKWTFFPAKFNGEKVAVVVDIPLSFSLN